MRFALFLLAAALPLQIGCDLEALAGGDRYQDDFQYTYDFNPGGKVQLETFNGSVEVLSWEKSEIRITGAKYASHERDMRDIRIEIEHSADSARIRAIRPEFRHGNMGARFFLRVPREVTLERITTSNGPIRIEDIRGNGRLETSNGKVTISRFDGELVARSSNGSVECYTAGGKLQLRTSNGSIRVEDANASLDAETSNSGITIAGFQPARGLPVRLATSNGPIDASFEQLDASDVRIATSNAGITLRLPAGVRARVSASTSNGPVMTSFDISGSVGKNSIEGSINGGGPLIHATSSNGPVRIEKM